jgi:Tfp pilus assembly protein PilV
VTPRRLHARRRPGIALIEAVLSSIVVSLMFIAAMRLVAATRTGELDLEYRHLASHLAAELMAEIMSQPYADPDGLPLFGLELNEVGATSRASFDDVDDYHGWTESPPQERDGTARTHLAGWTRSVEVLLVNPASPDSTSLVDAGVKKIIVTITRSDVPISRRTGLRSAAVER